MSLTAVAMVHKVLLPRSVPAVRQPLTVVAALVVALSFYTVWSTALGILCYLPRAPTVMPSLCADAVAVPRPSYAPHSLTPIMLEALKKPSRGLCNLLGDVQQTWSSPPSPRKLRERGAPSRHD